jgi:hypothetical protein
LICFNLKTGPSYFKASARMNRAVLPADELALGHVGEGRTHLLDDVAALVGIVYTKRIRLCGSA